MCARVCVCVCVGGGGHLVRGPQHLVPRVRRRGGAGGDGGGVGGVHGAAEEGEPRAGLAGDGGPLERVELRGGPEVGAVALRRRREHVEEGLVHVGGPAGGGGGAGGAGDVEEAGGGVARVGALAAEVDGLADGDGDDRLALVDRLRRRHAAEPSEVCRGRWGGGRGAQRGRGFEKSGGIERRGRVCSNAGCPRAYNCHGGFDGPGRNLQ